VDLPSQEFAPSGGRTDGSIAGRETEPDSPSFHAGTNLLWREVGGEKISEARLLVYERLPRLRLLSFDIIRVKRKGCALGSRSFLFRFRSKEDFMPIVSVNGTQISYWTGRKGILEGRETVLFIHGAGGGQYSWSYQKGYFEKDFNPIIIELPGHGESKGEGEEEIARYAEHTGAFLKALGLQRAFLVGHSMGGAIVQTLALSHPEMIKGVVLVGTGARLKVLPMILSGIKDDFEETVRRINQFVYSRKVSPMFIERGIAEMLQCRPEVLYGDFLACDRFDLMNEIEKIVLPTLILCGEDDQLTPLKYSQFLRTRIKGSKMEILPEAGHMVMMESSQLFNEKVNGFTEEVVKDSRRLESRE